jgi:hypothetical protein
MLSDLYTLLLTVIVAVSSWIVFGPIGLIICGIVLVSAHVLAGRYVEASVVLVIFLILVLLMLPAVHASGEAARRMTCTNQLKHIGLALHDYHQMYKCFPPAYVADKGGKPMHSWRVLILPFLDFDSLYRQYDFNEPWDGPNNREFLKIRLKEYVCPSDETASQEGSPCTSYVAVIGHDAAWTGGTPRALRDTVFREGRSNTIMVIETADSGINWTEPRDIELDALIAADPPTLQVMPGSKHMHSNGFFYRDTMSVVNTLLVDGGAWTFSASWLFTDRLKTILQVGGASQCQGEPAVDNQKLQINWLHCIGLPVWLVSVALLFHQSHRIRKKREQVANSDS